MSRKQIVKVVVLSAFLLLLNGTVSLALPFLQLDIQGGTYNASTETITTNWTIFKLYALIKTDELDSTALYYISASLVPKPSNAQTLGSFLFDGTQIQVTGDMSYGNPAHLGSHSIFDTYYKEFSFTFSGIHTSAPYNTGVDPGGPQPGTGLYYEEFNIDTSELNANYLIHFDLYDKKGNFAPFSHDAESGDEIPPVPEPNGIILLWMGLSSIGVAVLHQKK